MVFNLHLSTNDAECLFMCLVTIWIFEGFLFKTISFSFWFVKKVPIFQDFFFKIFYSNEFYLPLGCEGIFDVSFYNLYGSEFFVWVAWLNFCIQTKIRGWGSFFLPPLFFIQYPASSFLKIIFLIELGQVLWSKIRLTIYVFWVYFWTLFCPIDLFILI